MADELVYRAPPAPETSRRVYVLPVDLVKRIHEYGYSNGHQSEVAAVRELLENALCPKGGA
ncbi:hypothetical protein [Nitratireductor indicus]|uniref:hypothetical protein n=1 Tax=Nitratireductor indicus TaxID=721133 RepID=UPI0028758B21|nr:hypothetical protein [Nitratireductor indicus]MDS1138614.1 hypothetical protein [Nitratireductor indicus]